MIYITPPNSSSQGDSWHIYAEYSSDSPRTNKSFPISDKIARVFADKGVPVVLPWNQSVGATEEALVEALREIAYQRLRVNSRVIKEITYIIEHLTKEAKLLLPQIYWDCRKAWEGVQEAQSKYEALHEELMRYAANKLGLPEGVVLVEGPYKCIKSPTLSCLYDHDEDRCHDECLVCGEPEERK